MEHYYLPAATYSPSAPNASRLASPLDRRATINTIIEDSPQIPHFDQDYFSQFAHYPVRTAMISPTYKSPPYASPAYSEDFPTPKASLQNPRPAQQQPEENWPLSPEPVSSPRWRKSRDDPEFDELYDMTDDEDAEEVPLKCSNSVKKTSADSSARSSRSRYPSLVIPSPSHWPTIEKLQKSAVSPAPISALTPAQNVLNMLAARKLNNPATSAEPSLDGSLSSEELEHMSCPSTPDRHGQKEADWSGPVQLNPAAMETLHHISADNDTESVDQVLEVSDEEMSQVVGGDSIAAPIQRIFTNELTTTPSDADSFSALTIPSPGGFFSSLQDTARHTWSFPPAKQQEETPSTTVAENFYGVPWRERPDNVVEHVVEVPANFGAAEPTPTGADGFLSPVGEIMEIKPSQSKFEYNEHYAQELAQLAGKNLSRTSLWLTAQENWLEGMLSPTSPVGLGHERGNSMSDVASPSKKSVRFVDLVVPKTPPISDETLSKDTTFFEALEFLRETTGKFDAFIHRLTRAEAVHLQRRCASKRHNNLLLGKYELRGHSKIPSSRPVSLFYTDDPSVHKEQIAKAQKEQQALELVRPAFWALAASRLLHGGRLITSPAWKILSHTRDEGATRVLDLGGQAVCDWAWHVALDFPMTTVYTVSTKDSEPVKLDGEEERDIEGPPNHRHKVVPNYWTLPFPNGHFDVISARSLYALLRTSKPVPSPNQPSSNLDEYDLCLRECMRILKPGGYLEFALVDADIMHTATGSHTQAVSVEFAFNLRTRGYDAAPTKSFVPRLARAGFAAKDVRRAWTAAPFPRPAARWSDTLNVGADPVQAARRRDGDVLSPRASLHSPHAEKVIGPNGEVEPFVPAKGHKRADSLMDGVAAAAAEQPRKQQAASGSTKDARDVAGLVGARAWEKWLVKLQAEMGKEEEERLGEGVVQAMEEGARDGCAWRCLEGWARKGF
ncbi:Methyltransferase type 11 [Neofusicoccum parvum]|uniref:Methyltransferase type 11 n=1 Tax=Neofusicoccum parvum TaxID=310453 RepID=A0ACB5S2Q9_9PEZI|nr:Methyltransferase type 11 [Neofusicoccum parvum]